MSNGHKILSKITDRIQINPDEIATSLGFLKIEKCPLIIYLVNWL